MKAEFQIATITEHRPQKARHFGFRNFSLLQMATFIIFIQIRHHVTLVEIIQ